MSIILKGIDLPNGPIKLVLYPSGKVDEYVLNERIATDYQAIQIPTPHGRLIDAKVFADTICQAIQSGDLIQKSIWEWIADAPTILEAEEER